MKVKFLKDVNISDEIYIDEVEVGGINMADLRCPFCNGEVSIIVVDDEGNIHDHAYEVDPWSGVGYMLYHDETQTIGGCPIARHEGEGIMGMWIYDTREEAVQAWKIESGE